jgi:mannose-6-phosphate isomerase-like protein (cupin superfamily)
MTIRMATLVNALIAVAFAVGCDDPASPAAPTTLKPELTASTGGQSTLLGRATFGDPDGQNFSVKRITKDWHFDLKAKPAFDLAVQRIVFQPGGQSGWHTHPGPVFIQVVSGTMTFYMADDPECKPMVVSAGEGFLDLGEHPHIVRNESGAVAENLVTYFAPPGATLRIDADAPGNCPF